MSFHTSRKGFTSKEVGFLIKRRIGGKLSHQDMYGSRQLVLIINFR
jgi:hypothetical protein